MLIQVKSINSLKQEFFINVLNKCSNVTKIIPTSVINGIGYAISKLIQKINMDAARVESKLFPEYAVGTVLDDVGKREGIPTRLSASTSSVVLTFIADPATVYPSGTIVKGGNNIGFTTDEELTIDTSGIGHVLATSQLTGKQTQIEAYTLNAISGSPPSGHISVVNMNKSISGDDSESDYDYRARIVGADNILSQNTRDFYMELISAKNSKVVRIKTNPTDNINRNFRIVVIKNDGGSFTDTELSSLKNSIIDYIPLRDANSLRMSLENIEWTYVDTYAKIYLDGSKTLLQIAQYVALLQNEYMDFKDWEFGKKVDHEILQTQITTAPGVLNLDDISFTPSSDVTVGNFSLPRPRMITLVDGETNEVLGRTFSQLRQYESNKFVRQIITQMDSL